MTQSVTLPSPGDIVRVRQRQYLVEDVVPGEDGQATKVGLACVDDDAQGQQLEVLWEKEIDALNESEDAWAQIGKKPFDAPELFSAYLHTLKWNCVTATDAKLFQSPFRAGIKIDAYQLEPLRKALQLPRVSLFIADDVGLGKTIESGLIARELLLRRKVRDIVVVCPPSMIPQWREEMEQRFGLTFEVYDRAFVARMRQERGYAVNPWTTHPRFIISNRLVIDEAYAAPMRDWLQEMKPGALLILDEAHHAAPSSGSKYAIDTKITKAIRDIAARFEHRLFLSATPHNGHSNSFSALLEILDPQRFCRGVKVNKKTLEDVMVRRLKEDLRLLGEAFPRRVPGQVDIDGLPEDAPELLLPALLDQYRMLREQRLAKEEKKVQTASGIVVIGLQKRLLSSIEAFAKTLKVHRQTVEKHADAIRRGLVVPSTALPSMDLLVESPGGDDDRADWSEDEQDEEERVQMEAATSMAGGRATDTTGLALFARELTLLEQMGKIADEAKGKPDAKVQHLLSWIEANQCPGLRQGDGRTEWNDTRVIIFTEYEDTRRYLMEKLKAVTAGTDRGPERIKFLSGMTSRDEREAIKLAFNQDPKTHPLRILVATDAAREGLNLQSYCRDLFHFDVPWNPGRMEQRNGRIDRKLQPAKTVSCSYFFYRQRPEDQVLQKLVEKTETIRKELGSLGKVLEGRLNDLLLKQGIRRDSIQELKAQVEAEDLDPEKRAVVDEEFNEDGDRQATLAKQIEVLRRRIQDARDAIGLKESHFRSALSCSLKLQGAAPLQEIPPAQEWQHGLQRFAFPRLDLRQGAESNWGPTMDTLRAPRPRDQKPWEWRSKAPIRPVIFEDPGVMDDRVVHLHLEHRMVQRLLGRFIAQGFYHDLSRACFAHTQDAQPRVILLGRLSMYGPSAVRLHEELIPVTARWVEPSLRKGTPLAPYRKDAEARTLDLLEEALGELHPRPVPEARLQMLQRQAPLDLLDLLGPLKQQAADKAEGAKQKLLQRGRAEAESMREILVRQRDRIRETVSKHAAGTMLNLESTDEIRQLKADQAHWTKRMTKIEQELQDEPGRIERHYQVKVWRVEPVGLAYLWPVTG
jgi:superfamily II DNA or RNA helicase